MHGQSQFSQNPRYVEVSQFLPYYPPSCHTGNNYYPIENARSRGIPSDEICTEDPISLALKQREKNRQIVANFVGEHEDSLRADEKSISGVGKEKLKISQARSMLKNAFESIESLERLRNDLRNETLTDEIWQRKRQECTIIQDRLAVLIDEKFGKIDDNVEDLAKRLNQRKKKRRREARKRAQRRAERALAMEKRARRHDEADAWIREKRDMIERDKQIENLRKDADIVLADVRGKRSDARKFLGLLQELQNLRRVKVGIARGRGENLSLAADQAFDNIIGQLMGQWSGLDREYTIEEQGLKLMLKTDNEQKIEKQKRSTFDDWERALFGKKLRSSGTEGINFHGLLAIRHAWDKYANFEGVGSRIPIGWIMPVPPSSAAWQKCLNRK